MILNTFEPVGLFVKNLICNEKIPLIVASLWKKTEGKTS